MSARVFKSADAAAIASFTPFTPPLVGNGSPGSVGTQRTVSAEKNKLPLPSAAQSANGPAQHTESDLIDSAQSKARQIVDSANMRAAEIEQEARERGAAEGFAHGQRMAADEIETNLSPLMDRLSGTLHEIEELRTTVTRRAERDMVLLALEIAKKIVHREVRVDHEIALTLARVALSRIHSRAIAKVRLNPDDVEYIISHMDRLETNAAVEIVPDRSVSRGGCLVETEMGDIDARIEQQFAEVEREFLSL